MSDSMWRMRFKRAYRGYKAGAVVSMPKGVARSLEIFGFATRETQAEIEVAVAPEPAGLERAVAPVVKARRRRKAP
jgi:hypothetical protein